jgi:hypothetical protein
LSSGGSNVSRTPPMVNSRSLVMLRGFESVTTESEKRT